MKGLADAFSLDSRVFTGHIPRGREEHRREKGSARLTGVPGES
jgi:hypothetical protein